MLLLKRGGSAKAWQIVHGAESPLLAGSLQIFVLENRLQCEVESNESSAAARAVAANALQKIRWLVEQQVLEPVRIDYNIAVDLASQWQRRAKPTRPPMLILWPALAVIAGADEFLSFDPRTRELAVAAGLRVKPEKL